MIQVFFSSFLLVAASEMGDKTQLLAFALASRFKKPWPVMGGILAATLLNHGLASFGGAWISSLVSPELLRWLLALSFFGFAAWILIPDKDDDASGKASFSPFVTTTVAFFFAEMGDKTQLATVALGARFHSVFLVTAGTTLGMLVSDGLAVFLGDRFSQRIPMVLVRRISAALFFLFGLFVLLGPR